MNTAAHPKDSRLLAALPDVDWQRWQPLLERVDLRQGQVLYESGQPQSHAYFPTTATVSLLYTAEGGMSTEFAVVGRDGVIGTSIFLGAATTTSSGSVLVAGQGYRIGAQSIQEEFERSDAVRHLLLRYTQALLTQIAQTAVCFRSHSIDQQVCGWLLYSLDRLGGNEVVVTQELLASRLGVRRESVTQVAGQLREAGLIHCTRGQIEVIDRVGLERRSCECHAVVKKEYDRLLPEGAAARRAAPPRWGGLASAAAAPASGLARPQVAAMAAL